MQEVQSEWMFMCVMISKLELDYVMIGNLELGWRGGGGGGGGEGGI